MNTKYMLIVNNKCKIANSLSGRWVMAGQMRAIGKRGQVQPAARNVPVPVFRASGVSSFVPNKANFSAGAGRGLERRCGDG